MHDSLTSNNWRDFQQRYQGTYGWLDNKGKEIPVHIQNVSDRMVTFQGLDGSEFFSYADKDVKFRFAPLRRRLIIGGRTKSLLYITRHPARQWSRGICDNNTKIYTCGPDGRARAVSVNARNVEDVLLGENINEAVTDGQRILKLGDTFAINGQYVWLYSTPIGTFADNTISLAPRTGGDLFQQELRDIIRDFKYDIKVK
ncbi:MAG TPA: hypothetical protein VFM18_03190, partial [Methanosarcina sp.]|nr:hypothetical protein [Methanosarcina sp.]